MEKKTSSTSSYMIKRLIKRSLFFPIPPMILIYVFTKNLFYSIIFSLGAVISILGFLLMIKITDRVLKRGKGQWLFFLAALVKLAVITVLVYLAARVSKHAVLFYMLGLCIVIIAIGVEGIYQYYHSRNPGNIGNKGMNRSISNGRA